MPVIHCDGSELVLLVLLLAEEACNTRATPCLDTSNKARSLIHRSVLLSRSMLWFGGLPLGTSHQVLLQATARSSLKCSRQA